MVNTIGPRGIYWDPRDNLTLVPREQNRSPPFFFKRFLALTCSHHHLYTGLTPALLGAGVAWGVYFYAYNAAKRRYRRQTGLEVDEKLPPWLHLASAAEAGTIVRHWLGGWLVGWWGVVRFGVRDFLIAASLLV